eukprot:4827550-Pyramimonas_sp.AAC.1
MPLADLSISFISLSSCFTLSSALAMAGKPGGGVAGGGGAGGGGGLCADEACPRCWPAGAGTAAGLALALARCV